MFRFAQHDRLNIEQFWGAQAASLQLPAACRQHLCKRIPMRETKLHGLGKLPRPTGWQPVLPRHCSIHLLLDSQQLALPGNQQLFGVHRVRGNRFQRTTRRDKRGLQF
jgi:hypothetical protein